MLVVCSARFKVDVIITSGFIEYTLLLLPPLLLLPMDEEEEDIDTDDRDNSKADFKARASSHPFSDKPGSTIELEVAVVVARLVKFVLEELFWLNARIESAPPARDARFEEEDTRGDDGLELDTLLGRPPPPPVVVANDAPELEEEGVASRWIPSPHRNSAKRFFNGSLPLPSEVASEDAASIDIEDGNFNKCFECFIIALY